MAKSTKQIQEEITNKIIESLKQGTIPWRKPWSSSPNCGAPTNVVSGKKYRGINPLILSIHQESFGFTNKWYATFNQWHDLGASVMRRPDHVKSGGWGAGIIYYAPIKKTKEDPKTGEEVEVEFAMLKQYTVFSAEQVDLPDRLRYLVDVEPEIKNDAFIDFAPTEICSIRLRSSSVHADRCVAKRRRLTDTSDLDSPSIETNISRKRISKNRRRYKRLLPLRINLPTIALHRLWAGHESHGLRGSSSTTRTIAATVLIAGRRMNCEAWHTLQTVPKRYCNLGADALSGKWSHLPVRIPASELSNTIQCVVRPEPRLRDLEFSIVSKVSNRVVEAEKLRAGTPQSRTHLQYNRSFHQFPKPSSSPRSCLLRIRRSDDEPSRMQNARQSRRGPPCPVLHDALNPPAYPHQLPWLPPIPNRGQRV